MKIMKMNRYIETLFYAFVYIVIDVLKLIYYCTETFGSPPIAIQLSGRRGGWGGLGEGNGVAKEGLCARRG